MRSVHKKQQTLAIAADQCDTCECYRRPTRRDELLAKMDRIVPWAKFCALIEPHYPKVGDGRPPVGLVRMLYMYFVQHWFNLADEACEDVLLDSVAPRRFVGIDLGRERVSDGTTLLKFRRTLKKHKLGTAFFAKKRAGAARQGHEGGYRHHRGRCHHLVTAVDHAAGSGHTKPSQARWQATCCPPSKVRSSGISA